MPKTKIKQDEAGLFVKSGGAKYRPGDIVGWSHAYDMSRGGLNEGDVVNVTPLSGEEICTLTRLDGYKLRWGSEYEHSMSRDDSSDKMIEDKLAGMGLKVTRLAPGWK
jgi:hypothetical protein